MSSNHTFLRFTGDTLEQWWTGKLAFRLLAGSEVVSVGSGSLSLRHLLKSDNLSLSAQLLLKREDEDAPVGNVWAKIELKGEGTAFLTALTRFNEARSRVAEASAGRGAGRADNPAAPVFNQSPTQQRSHPPTPILQRHSDEYERSQSILQQQQQQQRQQQQQSAVTHPNPRVMVAPTPVVIPHSSASGLPPTFRARHSDESGAVGTTGGGRSQTERVVQAIVHVPFGVEITDLGSGADGDDGVDPNAVEVGSTTARQRQNDDGASSGGRVHNIYVVWRGFSSSSSSRVCYGSSSSPSSSSNPDLQFLQVIDFRLTKDSVEQMRHNFAVLEVWDKSVSAEEDRLVGIVKLSLHQLHLSFRDEAVANALLSEDAKYPVVAADAFQPIINPVNGLRFG